jgi:hypothetical protein
MLEFFSNLFFVIKISFSVWVMFFFKMILRKNGYGYINYLINQNLSSLFIFQYNIEGFKHSFQLHNYFITKSGLNCLWMITI